MMASSSRARFASSSLRGLHAVFSGAVSVSEWRAGLHRAIRSKRGSARSHRSSKNTGCAGAVVSAFVLDPSGAWRGGSTSTMTICSRTLPEERHGLVDRRAQESGSAHAWVAHETPKRPFFLWLHLYDPQARTIHRSRYRTQYALTSTLEKSPTRS